MVIRFLFLISFYVVSVVIVQAQPRFAEPGKCYGKCLISPEIVQDSQEYIIFTGDDNEKDVEIENIELLIKAPKTKWVKKKVDPNCISSYKNDCLEWYKDDIEAKYITLPILKDTLSSKNFVIKTIHYERIVDLGGYTDWREVLCTNDITPKLIKRIRQSLNIHGYDLDPNKSNLDTDFKKCLSNFQVEKNLPIGSLNIQTLEALGVL